MNEEVKVDLSLDIVLMAAFSEMFLFMAYVGVMETTMVETIETVESGAFQVLLSDVLPVMLSGVGSVYLNVTAWIDLLTGYVYVVINRLVFVICMIFLLFDESISFKCLMLFFLFFIFVVACEKMNAFSRGDSEFLMISYLLFDRNPWQEKCLELMLGVMLLSSISFGIFRKITGRKEGRIPFTPFIVFSEYIILILMAVLSGKEGYGII